MNYLKIDNCNMNNGDGLRCVVWLSGCSHHCPECFNPESWDASNGDVFGKDQLDLLLSTLQQDWCSGVTFTGGDPFAAENKSDVLFLCKLIKSQIPQTNIWLYTGSRYEDCSYDDLVNIDVLCDGEFIVSQKDNYKHWVGSSNQRVIDVQKSLQSNEIVLHKEG